MVSDVMEKSNAGNVTRRTEGRQTQVREDLAEKVTFVQSPEGGEGVTMGHLGAEPSGVAEQPLQRP